MRKNNAPPSSPYFNVEGADTTLGFPFSLYQPDTPLQPPFPFTPDYVQNFGQISPPSVSDTTPFLPLPLAPVSSSTSTDAVPKDYQYTNTASTSPTSSLLNSTPSTTSPATAQLQATNPPSTTLDSPDTLAGKKRPAEDPPFSCAISPSNVLSWTYLISPCTVLYDANMQPTGYDIAIESGGYSFSSETNSFIHYRRNQLKMSCTFVTNSCSPVQYVLNEDKLEQIESLSYAVSAIIADTTPPKQVDLYYSTVTREKRQKSPCLFSCVQGQKCILPKLYFAKATSHNSDNKKQEFFRVIVTLSVHTRASDFSILSKISDSLIVRGNHPGKYSPKVKEPSDTVKSVPLQLPSIGDTSNSHSTKITVFDGKVGINTKHPAEALTVMGNIALTGTIHQPSDIRIKENIKPLDTSEQLEKLTQVKLYEYTMKEEVDHTRQPRHGVIAQEVKEIYPNAVVESPIDLKLRNGQHISKLMLVDKDALLMETVGATIEIAKQVHKLKPAPWSLQRKIALLTVALVGLCSVMLLTCTVCRKLHD
ncbi:myelin regulatory factor [Pelomyxa schiedti]|nr:myelin regulatory factor [Pelomyxa schiedti]